MTDWYVSARSFALSSCLTSVRLSNRDEMVSLTAGICAAAINTTAQLAATKINFVRSRLGRRKQRYTAPTAIASHAERLIERTSETTPTGIATNFNLLVDRKVTRMPTTRKAPNTCGAFIVLNTRSCMGSAGPIEIR